MDFVQIGYYDDRQAARVPISRRDLKAAFGERPQQLRYEVLDGAVVLTAPDQPAYRRRGDI